MERDSTTTSRPGVIHYMAPELLNPPWFGLDHSSHSKESDVFSFAMTTYEVFSCYLVARVTNVRLPPSTVRFSQGSCLIVQSRRLLSPSRLHPGTVRLSQIIQQPTVGYLIPSGTSFKTAGPRFRSPGCPLAYYTKCSLSRTLNKRGTPRSPKTVKVSIM